MSIVQVDRTGPSLLAGTCAELQRVRVATDRVKRSNFDDQWQEGILEELGIILGVGCIVQE